MKASPGITTLPLLITGLIAVAAVSLVGIAIYRQSTPEAPVEALETFEPPSPSAVDPSQVELSSAGHPSSSPELAQSGQKAIHQQILKDFVHCTKNNEKNCICQYWNKQYCKSTTNGANKSNADLWYVLIPSHFARESDSDLLDNITTPADGRLSARYRLETSVEQTDEASFVYEDGAWKLKGID